MKALQFREITVERCIESEGPSFFPGFIFPNYDQDAFEDECHDWLKPYFVDAESGRLLMSLHRYIIKTPKHTIIVERCADTDTAVLAAHFAEPVAARIISKGDRWKLDLNIN